LPRALPSEVIRVDALAQLSVPDRPGVVLLAPSGYGKTTLLAQYARNTTRPVVWLSLGPGDEDTAVFRKNLCQAFHVACGVLPTDPTGALLDVMDRILEQMPTDGPGVDIVLDRAEHVTQTHGAFLAALIDLLPEGYRVLIATYDSQGFPLARLVASGHVSVLTTEHLRFTDQETATFLQAHDRGQDVAQLMVSSEGWPVSIALSLLESTAQVDINQLLHDALTPLPTEVLAALPDLALFDEWSDDLSDVLGRPLPPEWLTTLRRAGLPLTPLGRGLYRPHRLLLNLLERQLQRLPDRNRQAHLLRAQMAAQDHDLSTALRHARRAERPDLMEAYARDLFPALRVQLDFTLLNELAGLHPGRAPDWWLELQAVAQLETGQGEAGLSLLHTMLNARQLSGVGFAALALHAARQGNFEGQLTHAQAGLDVADGTVRTALAMQLASAFISLERFADGEQVTDDLIRQARAQGDDLTEANVLSMHQYTLLMQRRWMEREEVLRRARSILQAHGQRRRALQIDTEWAQVLIEQGQHDEAAALLTECIELALRTQPIHLPTLYQALARLKLIRGDRDGAAHSLANARDVMRSLNLPVLLPFLHASHFDLHGSAADLERADQAYAQLRDAAQRPIFRRHLLPLFEGLHALDHRQADAARAALSAATRDCVDRTHAARAQTLLLALDAQQGQLSRAALDASRHTLQALDVPSVTYADQRHLSALRAYLAAHCPEHPLAGQAAAPTALPDPVSVGLRVEVGRKIELWAGDQPVKLPLAKAGELLLWLLWHGRGTLHDILNDLWDGSRDPKHHEYFRVVVRRLRQTLKDALGFPGDPLPYAQGAYALQPELNVALNLRAAQDAARNGDPAQLLRLHVDALATDLTSDWFEAIRDSLRQDQLYALGEIEGRISMNDPGLAVTLMKQAVRAQPADAETHLALIRVLLRHEPSSAPSAFQAYRLMLEREYGEVPSREVLSRFRDLGLITA